MKKAPSEDEDWLRPEYTRADLGEIVRGKYADRLGEETNIVVLDPEVAQAFPNVAAVNNALRGLLQLAQASARISRAHEPEPRGSAGG